MFNKSDKVQEPTCEITVNVNLQIVGMAMGCVLAQSENTLVKASGVGLVTASFLRMVNKLAKI
ncbi:hypothetical protein AH06_147 [Erwinia phage AH06]|nr:hypothetical protein AH06_147 [Erwinia phage AH06]